MATFQERLHELTKERGTMARLSEGSGISTGLLSNYKSGKFEPSLTNAILIADFFDVSLDWLAGRDGYARDAHRHPAPSPASEIDRLCEGMDPEYRTMLLKSAVAYAAMSEKDTPVRGRAAEGAVR